MIYLKLWLIRYIHSKQNMPSEAGFLASDLHTELKNYNKTLKPGTWTHTKNMPETEILRGLGYNDMHGAGKSG